MILYRDDFLRYPAHIQWNTKNDSFLRVCMVLRRMGVENNTFFLALHQPELADVDPWENYLPPEIRQRILLECKTNCWYFFREVLRVPAPGGDPVPFILSRGNLAAIWTFFNDIDFSWIQPRQTGKTYGTQSIVAYMMNILADNLSIGLFTKDQDLVQDNVARLKELRDVGIPGWMISRSTKDWDRKEGISYALKKNYYKTFTSANDERSAYKLGRGATFGITHFDEIAFMNYNWIIVPTAMNAMLKASEMVRKSGLPSPSIFTTTAGNPDTKEGSFALKILESALPFREEFYDLKNRNALLDIVEKNATSKMLHLEFSYRQLGFTDQWFKEAASRSKASQDDINRDLLNIWQSSTDKAIIPLHILQKMRDNKREPCFVDLTDEFVVRWYKDRSIVETSAFQQRPLVMGMDTSENVGRDYTTFTILDPTNLEVMATCRCNESNTMQVARHVLTLLERYPRMLYIPERNNTGVAIIDFCIEELVKRGINPFTRIYNEVVQNLDDPKYKNVSIYDYHNLYGRVRASFGFRTSGNISSPTSRNILYKVTMMKFLEMSADKLYDRTLISEYSNLTEKNGRIDHRDGLHDDTVISSLLGAWLIFFGKNLHIYNIPDSSILSTIALDGSKVTPQQRQQQVSIKQRIADLEDKISQNPTYILKQAYIREKAYLETLVDDKLTDIRPLAVTQVKHQEKELSGANSKLSESRLRDFVNRFTASKTPTQVGVRYYR